MSDSRSEIRDLIDACRRQSDDVQQPELRILAETMKRDSQVRETLEKSHRIDAAIGAAMRDVAIPDGLEERLLVTLGNASGESQGILAAPVAAAVETTSSGGAPEMVPAPRPASPRRSWRVWAGLTGAAAAMVVLAFVLSRPHELKLSSPQEVAEQAAEWKERVNESQWRRDGFPRAQFPLPAQPRLSARGWQPISGARVVCYDIASRGNRVWLFVARTKPADSLPTAPPRVPYPSGSAWRVGGWKGKDVVFVLATEGSDQHYLNVIRQTSDIAALLPR